MACTGTYAEAWEYAAFWCAASILLSTDNSGGAGNAALTDTTVNFENFGAQPNVGMTLYNLTDGSSGAITAVTPTTVTATLAGGTTNLWSDGDEYRLVTLKTAERSQVQHYLNITAGDIHAALAAANACDCTLAAWGENELAKMNIVLAGALHSCPCARTGLSDDDKGRLLDWVTARLEEIRVGKVDVCDGATGSDWPSIDWAERSLTDFARREIVANRIERDRSG
jgi:hypothetical protein